MSDHSTQVFEITNETGTTNSHLLLSFAPDRFSIESIRTISRKEVIDHSPDDASKVTQLLQFPDEASPRPCDVVRVEIMYQGESPILLEVFWFVEPRGGDGWDNQAEIAPPLLDESVLDGDLEIEDFKNKVRTRAFSLDAIDQVRNKRASRSSFAKLKCRLRNKHFGINTEERRWSEFFLRLDYATHPGLLGESRRKADRTLGRLIEQFSHFLKARITRRAYMQSIGLRLREYTLPSELTDREARKIESLMRELFESPELCSNGILQEEKLFRAFKAFLQGRLVSDPNSKVAAVHGGPRGDYFLCFAEFVFFVRDIIPDRFDFWKPGIRPLVILAEAFIHMYWNGGERVGDSYQFADAKEVNQLSLEQWKRLVASYDSQWLISQMEDRFSATCAFAYRDEITRSKRVKDCLVVERRTPYTEELPPMSLWVFAEICLAGPNGEEVFELSLPHAQKTLSSFQELAKKPLRVGGRMAWDNNTLLKLSLLQVGNRISRQNDLRMRTANSNFVFGKKPGPSAWLPQENFHSAFGGVSERFEGAPILFYVGLRMIDSQRNHLF